LTSAADADLRQKVHTCVALGMWHKTVADSTARRRKIIIYVDSLIGQWTLIISAHPAAAAAEASASAAAAAAIVFVQWTR